MTKKEKLDRRQIKTDAAKTAAYFDAIFTFAAIIFAILAVVNWIIALFTDHSTLEGNVQMILALAFWIASTQLQPYWDRYCPTRCKHQPLDPDEEISWGAGEWEKP